MLLPGSVTEYNAIKIIGRISINAIHAIGAEGGKLTIRGSVVPRRELEALFPEEKISEEWPNYVCLSVTDTGCGVEPGLAERVFDRFYKVDPFAQGLGLGLSLCRLIAEKLGGTIGLDTTYTGGARFVVTLRDT